MQSKLMIKIQVLFGHRLELEKSLEFSTEKLIKKLFDICIT